MPTIRSLEALEILDSRGRPTVRVQCTFESGATAGASVPSGASTGTAEAHELRDGDLSRYGGLGCRRAVANVVSIIAPELRKREFRSQADVDRRLVEIDGTANKARLGANALLGVSLAFARACAVERAAPLYVHFAEILRRSGGDAARNVAVTTLPRMTINLFSGGKHAGGQIPIQDVLVVPLAATVEDGLAQAYAVYQAAAALSFERYRARTLVADEGGLAPPFESAEAMLEAAVGAIERAGLQPGRDVALAVDVAASHFYVDGGYRLDDSGALPAAGMIDRITSWVRTYPILSVEDGLDEDDWAHWPALHDRLAAHGVLTLGDDLLCTSPARIERAVAVSAADALLLKVNQIGTVSEAAEAYQLARAAGWRVTVSARSGETEDDWLADLAVGWSGDQIKIGSITRSERLAKYNRLLAIEAETRFPVIDWPSATRVPDAAPA